MRPTRVAAVLGAMCAVSILLVFPYVLQLYPRLHHLPVPLPVIVGAQMLQGGVLCFLLAWIGLRLGRDLGLGAPLLQRVPGAKRSFALVIAIGVATGAAMLALDLVLLPLQPAAIRDLAGHLSRWKGLLASFYGGIGEEVELRLFVMTLFAWMWSKVTARRPSVYVGAALLASLVFAAAHLPVVKLMTPLTPIVVTRVLVLNMLGGIVFGIVYWKRGIEHAMLAHFSADLILHVVSS